LGLGLGLVAVMGVTSPDEAEAVRWSQAGSFLLLTVIGIAYFPAAPAAPPSLSAGRSRPSIKESIKISFRSKRFLFFAALIGLVGAVNFKYLFVFSFPTDLLKSDLLCLGNCNV
jgi:hypothetical protein